MLTIRNQPRAIQIHLAKVPSLKAKLSDSQWWKVIWGGTIYLAAKETGWDNFPEQCIWSVDGVLAEGWLPQA